MPRNYLDQLLRKEVEVRANGISYRGKLVEVTEEGITLRGLTGFCMIPMERITSVRDPKAKPRSSPARFVDSSFYTADEAESKDSE